MGAFDNGDNPYVMRRAHSESKHREASSVPQKEPII